MISSQTKLKIEKNVYERQFWRGKQQGVKETEKKRYIESKKERDIQRGKKSDRKWDWKKDLEKHKEGEG